MSNLRKEQQKTISKVDQSQLKKSNNSVNVYHETQDTPKDFTIKGTDRPADLSINVKGEFENFPETSRFSKKLSIDEKSLRENSQRNA